MTKLVRVWSWSQYIFTQLVSFGEKTNDTRRLATRNDIGEENWNLVTQLAGSERELEARLVTTGYDELTQQPTVEVVHEALIKGWKRLQDWMKDDWEFRKWQDRLRTQINIWENKNKDNIKNMPIGLHNSHFCPDNYI